MSVTKRMNLQDFEKHCLEISRLTPVDRSETLAQKNARIKKLLANYAEFFAYYFPNYAKAPTASFHKKLAKDLQANKMFRGIFEAFRGSAKSTHATIGIPLWLKARGELKCMLLVGQNEKKAFRLLASMQAQLNSNKRYINDYGDQRTFGNWAEGEFVTKDGCAFFAIGLSQSPRGTRQDEKRPDYIVVDDCDTKKLSKNPQLVREACEWVLGDLMGCFDGPGRFLLVNNRISKNSILARLQQKMVEEKPNHEKWWHIQVNALDEQGKPTWPEKYTVEEWQKVRNGTDSRSWQCEYMNNPIEEGTVFNEKWIKWGPMYKLSEYDDLVVYVDPSFKDTVHSDFKAVKFWGKKGTQYHLIDAWVRQASIAQMVRYMYDLYERIPKGVIVRWYMESNFLQDMIFDAFEEEGELRRYQLPIVGDDRNKPDKYSRIEATSPLYERGWITYNEAKKNDPDFATAVEQLLAIEPGSKSPDDSPDADEGAIYKLNLSGRVRGTVPVIGEREVVGW